MDLFIIKIILNNDCFAIKKKFIKFFKIIIINFDNLPEIITKTILVINIENDLSFRSIFQVFAKNIFNIEIEKSIKP
jgi:ribosomal protein L19